MSNVAVIETLVNEKRTSTQDLLQNIYQKMEEGYCEFDIKASGQHDIGGPLWSKEGHNLTFRVSNPGQRVGSMGMPGTTIVVEGSAPADVGWLNAGADITVKGDGGDTTAHCAASGKIYVGGRVGTRSGALMKFDPKFTAPEFWVLKNTGSFSFEFMSGGTAVVCGYGCDEFESILGSRSCVGMVGGTIYVRGPVHEVSKEVFIVNLDENDKEFLSNGLKTFLEKIDKPEIITELTNWDEWKKIVPKTFEQRKPKKRLSLKEFRQTEWVEKGIFADVYKDDYAVMPFVAKGINRLRIPEWKNHALCAPCEGGCPLGIPTQERINLIKNDKLKEAIELVLDYTPFPASVCGNVCPNLCMENCSREMVDEHIKVAELGKMSRDVKLERNSITKTEKIAIIGAGSSGLSCAFQLNKLGYYVEVMEQDEKIGGKLSQVIPSDRLDPQTLQAELDRLKKLGINFKTGIKVTKELFSALQSLFDAVVIAIGAHNPVVIPFEGHEKLVKGLDFLKKINKGEKPQVGEKVVVIGAGNAAMDVVLGAYKMGAKEVTSIDIQKPAAFQKEINHAKALGAKILWPCFTKKITDQGVVLKDGTVLEANTVIISIGDRPQFSFIDETYLTERGQIKVNKYKQSVVNPKVFAAGDAIKQGLFVNALADGKQIALNLDNLFNERALDKFEKPPVITSENVKPQYYEGCSAKKVSKIEAYEEKNRCMSCGLCRDCEMCLTACPEHAIEKFENEKGETIYASNEDRCIGCGICAGVCPCGVWTMKNNLSLQNN